MDVLGEFDADAVAFVVERFGAGRECESREAGDEEVCGLEGVC